MSPTRSSRLRVFGVSRTRPSHRARISPTSPTTVEATGMAQIGLLQEPFFLAESTKLGLEPTISCDLSSNR